MTPGATGSEEFHDTGRVNPPGKRARGHGGTQECMPGGHVLIIVHGVLVSSFGLGWLVIGWSLGGGLGGTWWPRNDAWRLAFRGFCLSGVKLTA
jgi:hypothetical protein